MRAECPYAGLRSFARVSSRNRLVVGQAVCCRRLYVSDLLSFRQFVAVITKWQPVAVIELPCEPRLLECADVLCSARLVIIHLHHFYLHPVCRVVTIQRRQGKWFNSSDSFSRLITRFSIDLQCYHLARLDVG